MIKMTPKLSIKYMQKVTNTSQTEIGEKTGLKNNVSVCKQIGNENIHLNTYKKIIESMGWEIVVRPKDSLDLDKYISL